MCYKCVQAASATATPLSVADKAAKRREQCETIAAYARTQGLDGSWQQVNSNLPIWERWYYGVLSKGYLIKQTGVKTLGYNTTTPRKAQPNA